MLAEKKKTHKNPSSYGFCYQIFVFRGYTAQANRKKVFSCSSIPQNLIFTEEPLCVILKNTTKLPNQPPTPTALFY